MAKNKKIKAQPAPQSGKRIAPPETTAVNAFREPPMFSMRYLQKGFDVEDCEKDDQAAFARRLCKWSKMTWQEIQSHEKHGLGHETMPHKSMRVALPPQITPDVNILVFRLSFPKTIIGYKDGVVFYVLWIDPDLKCYDH